MKETIDKIAYAVSSLFINGKINLNDSIRLSFQQGLIENQEVLKRVCEEANKQVYLALFHGSEDKSNINFDLASPEKVMSTPNSTLDYQKAPANFNASVVPVATEMSKVASDDEYRVAVSGMADQARRFAYYTNSEKLASYQRAEKLMDKVASLAESMAIVDHDSAFDICKIASDVFMEETGSPVVSLGIVSHISEHLEKKASEGHKIETMATKLASSYQLNDNDPFVTGLRKLAQEIILTSAFNDIEGSYNQLSKGIANAK